MHLGQGCDKLFTPSIIMKIVIGLHMALNIGLDEAMKLETRLWTTLLFHRIITIR